MTDLFDQASLLAQAETLVAAARKAGADAADCVALRGVSQEVSWREGRVEGADRAEGDEFGLRVFVGRRSAIVSSNDVKDDVLELARRAVTMARAAPDDPYADLADPDLLAREWPDLDLLDSAMPSTRQLEDWAKEMENAALAVDGVRQCGSANASTGLTGLVFVTSHGFAGQSLASWTSLSVTAVAGEGTAMQRDYDYSVARHACDLKSAQEIGQLAGERAVKSLNPRKIVTQKAPILFDRRVASSFVSHLLDGINGGAVARKTSFLRDRMGERLFRPGISIVDDPLQLRGLASRGFDAEGVRRQPLALIDNGVLASWLLDVASARELGLTSTGHAVRGASSPPHPSASNVHLAPGRQSPSAMLREMGSGLYVTGFMGHGPNLVTGDYSRGCNGFWIENGEIAYPVAEITVAGHLSAMFASLEPADDLLYLGSVNAPSVRIEGMTIAGL